MTRFTAKESKKQRQSRLDDFEFMDYCFKIIDMELNQRESSHNSEEEEILSVYATKQQWVKHPLMHELILGNGLDDSLFKDAINQKFHADGQEWIRESFNNLKEKNNGNI